MSIWFSLRERDALARLVLLELFQQALCDDRRLGELSDRAGGRPSGRPPAGEAYLLIQDSFPTSTFNHFRELAELLKRSDDEGVCAAEQRRAAELWELLNEQSYANYWWQRAADSGDEDAKDYLEILKAENKFSSGAGLVSTEERLADCVKALNSQRLGLSRGDLPQVTKRDVEMMFAEIEKILTNPDQVADGGRRI
ncbi:MULTISPECIES: hypothetical protein [Streptomyces]|uniref:Uncharacterized protein n=1 Tax=Streptomyces tsukubensis (strain DSM 42081 / NBRC 108919 / NRRL 18488 / 9993) TaxID=1114943 RepID=I2N9U5_STRT9|nr:MULTISPECIES: hypothetical protein [Streptomyces]AZK97615.1 hypothetical protein B7R87_29810 [Streptomyces tsukubensis]EIF93792.1 hypothetical protein [Streptomyces tsukubensis NRRL18488]MYS66290.1 hypothetical protein [Streptomyces sp. SID5473]QKM66444.1 hypothetical protein STSU_003965 [Streptomyces tsukubensis NRRL18488]TAI45217.1 hypothetical protein EWI31_08265 [Streptomyces tsukubensis]